MNRAIIRESQRAAWKWSVENLRRLMPDITFPQMRLRQLCSAPEGAVLPEEVLFLEEYLPRASGSHYALLVQVLCHFGHPLSRYVESLPPDLSARDGHSLMEIAARQSDPESVLRIIQRLPGLKTAAMMMFKKMGRAEYLAEFLLSEDPAVGNFTNTLLENEDA